MTLWRPVEWLSAKAAVALDGVRPLRGPLARPAWWCADFLTDLSLWAHTHGAGWGSFSRQSHRRTAWGYIHPLTPGGKRQQ